MGEPQSAQGQDYWPHTSGDPSRTLRTAVETLAALCQGCLAKDAEIGFLRAQVEKLQDRAFELARPPAPAAPEVPQGPEGLDPDRIVQEHDGANGMVSFYRDPRTNRKVRLEHYVRVLKEGGAIADNGDYVSPDEYGRTMDKLNEMTSGGRA